ncbi:uncharacterized protein LOC122500253 [Leptopilina heterotoma]|uniref:uncharacterized protein LOC122500253 n=1 Tax=Leptopilina heterotoma TaxID=63436 RepID=UPI001CA8DDAB|nr:uncharacterized protein LOC122500253 [Leptopilina heterotoma]
MKAVSIGLLVFLLTFYYSSAQNLVLPTEELLKKYLNLSKEEIIKKCRDKDPCLVSKAEGLEKAKQEAGNDLINHLVNEAKKLPSVTENDWNTLTQNNCISNPFFIKSVEMTFVNGVACLSPGEIPSSDVAKKALKEYVDIFCSRVKEAAKKKFQSV